jgi:hypothetical protein
VRSLKATPNSSANGGTVTWSPPSSSGSFFTPGCNIAPDYYTVSYAVPGVPGLAAPQTVYGTSISFNTFSPGTSYKITVTPGERAAGCWWWWQQ